MDTSIGSGSDGVAASGLFCATWIGVWGGESEAAPNGKFSLPRRGVESVLEKFVLLLLPVRVLAFGLAFDLSLAFWLAKDKSA